MHGFCACWRTLVHRGIHPSKLTKILYKMLTISCRVMDFPRWKLAKIVYICVVTYQKYSSWIEEGAFTETLGQMSKGTSIGQGQGHKPKRVMCGFTWCGIECSFQRYQIHGRILENVEDIANCVRTPALDRLYPPKNDAPVSSTSLGQSVWNLRWSGVV